MSLVDHGELESSYANDFKGAMYLREKATYSSEYDEASATKVVSMADKFIDRMKQLIK